MVGTIKHYFLPTPIEWGTKMMEIKRDYKSQNFSIFKYIVSNFMNWVFNFSWLANTVFQSFVIKTKCITKKMKPLIVLGNTVREMNSLSN